MTVLPFFAFGQQTDRQSSVPDVRQPTEQNIDSYAQQEDFIYRSLPKEDQSLVEKIFAWGLNQIAKLLDNPTANSILKYLFILLFIGLIVLLINQFMKGNISNIIRSHDIQKQPITFNKQDLDNLDLDELINNAITDNNYSLAVRYLYQQKLKQLQEGGYINWKKEKTNRTYLYEIDEPKLRTHFRELTQYYELIEYGNFPINSTDFQSIHEQFKEMRTLIRHSS
ncbi:DUF4129 domain-containing protein [Fodinibius sp. AD559]|uniref:DUF4129 domain-containing protein n=1 Tax=Fodinibius sp. AD559 TaxID=3424179 RepID=UPI004046936B